MDNVLILTINNNDFVQSIKGYSISQSRLDKSLKSENNQ